MESFLEFCAGTRLAKAILQSEPKEDAKDRSESPIAKETEGSRENVEALYNDYQCGNLSCLSITKDVSSWKEVKIKNIAYYFCSEECYNYWLESPSYIGCWSPIKIVTERNSPPPLEI